MRIYVAQVLSGLEYLHFNGIIHKDIKGANMLLTTGGIVKLSDFGSSKRLVEQVEMKYKLEGSVYWMAPEVIKDGVYSRSADIWSLGCTVYEMLTGLPPFA